MARGVTTEWEDIQVKYGNYLARDKETTNDELIEMAIEAVENYDPLEKKNLEELKDLEDSEDEEVLKQYELKRMEELKQIAQKPRFGQVIEFRKQDYVTEINNAPKDVYVIIHLYKNWSENSNILSRIFDNLAKKFVLVKFTKIEANNCIPNFQDKDVPGVLIYKNGKMIQQYIPATETFGGNQMSWKKVEWILHCLKIVKSDLEEDPFEEEFERYSSLIKKGKNAPRDDESDEDEKEDRQYSWKISRK